MKMRFPLLLPMRSWARVVSAETTSKGSFVARNRIWRVTGGTLGPRRDRWHPGGPDLRVRVPMPFTCLMQAISPRRTTDADRGLATALFAVVQGSRHALQDPVDRVTVTVLADIKRVGPVRPSDLAEQLRLDLSTVSRHLSNLAKRGLVERTADPADARAHLVHLTLDGQRLLSEIFENRAANLGAAVRRWSATDRRHLVELLERLAHDLNQEQSS